MNNFVVPQFIDVEAKILGPITLRQFVISLIGGFAIVIAYRYADTGLFIIASLAVAGLVFLFGFFKINGRGFHLFLLNVMETLKRPRIRVWKPKATAQVKNLANKGEIGSMSEMAAKQSDSPSRSRLQQLTLVVDTGGVYRAEE
jgi:hypothetical protein